MRPDPEGLGMVDALMSDSDVGVPSRPPTPTFLAAKAGAKLQEQNKAKEPVEVIIKGG